MLFVNATVLQKPEVFIGGAARKFDASGRCIEEATRSFVGDQMRAFERFIDVTKQIGAAKSA
jgi:chromate reductase